MCDGSEMTDREDDLAKGQDLGIIYKNRLPNERGVAHGGVANFTDLAVLT